MSQNSLICVHVIYEKRDCQFPCIGNSRDLLTSQLECRFKLRPSTKKNYVGPRAKRHNTFYQINQVFLRLIETRKRKHKQTKKYIVNF